MKKIDIKQSLDERVQSTEWTDKNTWNVLDRVRMSGRTREKRRISFLLPAAALVILAICIGITSIVNPGTPDLIRPAVHTIQPLAISNHDGPSACEESIHSVLADSFPEIADDLIPVDLYCETNGIRITVDSALIKGEDAYILFTAQDLEGDRINQSMGYFISLRDDAGNLWEQKANDSLAYSPEEHKAVFLAHCRADGTVTPGAHKATVSIEDVRFCETTRVDLLPMLGQYAPADREGIAETDVPLYKTASLTGIGWNGDTLRVQIRTSDEDVLSLAYAQFGCCVRNANRYTDVEFGDEGHEYISTVYPDERDQLTELAVYFREFPEMAEGPWELEFNISVPGNGEASEAAQLSDAEAAISSLRKKYPEIAEELRPLNLKCIRQGIRVEIVSALVKGNSSWILWTLQDLEDDRINETSASIFSHPNNIGGDADYVYCYKNYNEKEKKLTVLEEIRYDTMNEPEDGWYLLDVNNVYTYEDETVDLKPMLERYRSTAEGVDPPEDAWPYCNGIQGDPVPQDLKVLDYENPANILLTEKGRLLLTGIGWIDGKLHVQIHEADPAFCETDDDGISQTRNDSVIISNWSGEGEPFRYSGDSPYAWKGSEEWDEWLEFVLESTPEDEETMTLTAELSYTARAVQDTWEFRIPVSMIRAEEETEKAETAETESVPAGTGSPASGTGMSAYNDHVLSTLKYSHPELADKLRPVNLAFEKDGIRQEVLSAVILGENACVVYTLQDMKGDREISYMRGTPSLTDRDGTAYMISREFSWGYDAEERKIAFLGISDTKDAFRPGDHTVSLNIRDVCFYEDEQADLIPLLEQYAPAGGEMAEVDIPLYKTARLTGIGWVDGQLHIQLRSSDYKEVELHNVLLTGIVTDADGNVSSVNSRLTERRDLEKDGDARSQGIEFVLEVSPEETDGLEDFGLTFSEIADVAEGLWETEFTVTAVQDSPPSKEAVPEETGSI